MARKRITRGSVKPAGVNEAFYGLVDAVILEAGADEGTLHWGYAMLSAGVGYQVQVWVSVNSAGFRMLSSTVGLDEMQNFGLLNGLAGGEQIEWYAALLTPQGELVAKLDVATFEYQPL